MDQSNIQAPGRATVKKREFRSLEIGSGLTQKVARLAGIEPTTLGFGGQYSIH